MRLGICLLKRKITLTQKKHRTVSSSVGDIVGTVFNQKHIPDLSWLDLDEKEYHKFEALPKRNFDCVPDMEEFFNGDSEKFVPIPVHMIVNTNPSEHPSTPIVDVSDKIRKRTARLVMQNVPESVLVHRLSSEFSPTDLKKSESTIRDLSSQRGLLGPVYFYSSDFPLYHKTGSEDSKFITKHAKNALFIISDNEMDSVTFSRTKVSSADKIPYQQIHDHYSTILSNRYLKVASSDSAKDSIQASFKNLSSEAPVETQKVRAPVRTFSPRSANSTESLDGFTSDFLKFSKRMMSGHDDRNMLMASKVPELVSLASRYGILGHEYLDVDVLGGCAKTADFMKKSKTFPPKYLVRRASCNACDSLCSCKELESKSVFVSSVPELTRRDFIYACWKANQQGRIEQADFEKIVSSRTASDSWSSLCARVNTYIPSKETKVSKPHTQKAHFSSTAGSDGVDAEEMRVFVAKLQNRGLSMEEIRTQLTLRYPISGIIRNASVIKQAMRQDGVVGHHYVDPSCYKDYGRGCDSGSKQFRGTGPKNVVAGKSCTGCVLQTHPGWCSKYAKTIIRPLSNESMDSIRTASTKKSLPVLDVPVRDPGKEWGLGSPDVDFSIPSRSIPSIKISRPE